MVVEWVDESTMHNAWVTAAWYVASANNLASSTGKSPSLGAVALFPAGCHSLTGRRIQLQQLVHYCSYNDSPTAQVAYCMLHTAVLWQITVLLSSNLHQLLW